MTDVASKIRVIIVWLLGVLLFVGDFLIKRVPHWRDPISIEVGIDPFFPFWAEWVWIYLIGWLLVIFGGGGLYLWEHRHEWVAVRRLLWAGVLMQTGAWFFHVLVPTYMPRPLLPAELDSASLLLIAKIYAVDPYSHVLPSQHVASVTVLAWFLGRKGLSWQALIGWTLVILISFSVLFTKQHGILDVFTGFFWGIYSCHLGWLWGGEKVRPVAAPAFLQKKRQIAKNGLFPRFLYKK